MSNDVSFRMPILHNSSRPKLKCDVSWPLRTMMARMVQRNQRLLYGRERVETIYRENDEGKNMKATANR